jgi:large subunit ribosomal protein L3
MTQVFDESDQLIPVTVIEAGPCVVTQVKTTDRDGYDAVQLAFDEVAEGRSNSPMRGHFAKAKVAPRRHLAEVRVSADSDHAVGDELTVELFSDVAEAKVTGVSKGKGFAGVVKRYGFSGGPGGHGSHFHRSPGAIGQCASPSRVFPGMKMPGHMGSARTTVRNLTVVRVDADENLLLIKGAVPGGSRALVMITATAEGKPAIAGEAKPEDGDAS